MKKLLFSLLILIPFVALFLSFTIPSFAAETWPTGTVVDTLRQGLNGYTGADDCYLDEVAPTTARGAAATGYNRIWLEASNDSTSSVGLMKFNLTEARSGIPATNTVLRAVLRLTLSANFSGVENTPYLAIMRMHRAWGDSTATWDSTGVGTAGTGNWYLGGADSTFADSLTTAGSDTLSDPPADRGSKIRAAFQVGINHATSALALGSFFELDVTSMVQRMQNGTWTNDGWFLSPAYYGGDPSFWDPTILKLASSEHATASYRPTLFVWSAPVPAEPDTVTVNTGGGVNMGVKTGIH